MIGTFEHNSASMGDETPKREIAYEIESAFADNKVIGEEVEKKEE